MAHSLPREIMKDKIHGGVLIFPSTYCFFVDNN